MSFYQSVVKQKNCLDTTGAWTVVLNNTILGNSVPSTSFLAYNDKELNWEYREITFTANTSSIDFKFLPYDDDANLTLSDISLNGALRMGLDQVELTPVIIPTINIDTTLCSIEALQIHLNYANANYTWFDNDQSNNRNLNSPGTYSVKVETPDSSFKLVYTLDYFSPIPTNLNIDTNLCIGNSLTLYSPQTANSFYWNSNITADSITINSSGAYTYTQYLENCKKTDTINVALDNYPSLSLQDTTLCAGELLTYNLPSQYNYYWQDGNTSPNYSIQQSGSYSLEVANNHCIENHTIEVEIIDSINYDGISDTVLCYGESYSLYPPQGNFNATWSTSIQGNLNINQGGNYYLNLNNYCFSEIHSFNVQILPELIVDLGADLSICKDDSITLTPFTNSNLSYLWDDGSNADQLTVYNAGSYTLEAYNNNCSVSDTIEIKEIEAIEINLLKDTSVCQSQSVFIEADVNNYDYAIWSNGLQSTSILASKNGFYTITASNSCEVVSDSVHVEFINCEEDPIIYAPNAFTPNGDSHNNSFQFVSEDSFDRFEWMIFNRWGELVFSSTDVNASWNGRFQNKNCKDGIYLWKLSYSTSGSANVEQLTGSVGLLR